VTPPLERLRNYGWVDLLLVAGVVGLVFGLFRLAAEAGGAPRPPSAVIDLDSFWALPRYTFFSLARGLIAYAFSLLFTLGYGYWAAKDPVARRVLIPLLDVLQSIPVLGFMPGLLLVFTSAFPGSNIGLELAAIISIFTGQAWNMTFYQSVRSVPQDMLEAATVYRLGWWQRFRLVEVPFATMGLVWNSMMSMAGGWFFLVTIEGMEIGDESYWSPGIGSYIKAASSSDPKNWTALLSGIAAMVLMIVALDQLLWRPVVAWAQKFRVEEGGAQEKTTSWFLDFLRRSRLVAVLFAGLANLRRKPAKVAAPRLPIQQLVDPTQPARWTSWLSSLLFVMLLIVLVWGAYQLILLMMRVPAGNWGMLGASAGLTLLRVLTCVVLGTLWALPAGLAIGLSPRLARIFQPVVQVMASFPAPLLFPLVILGLDAAGLSLNWGSIVLMLLGTQWYILFNVIAGAMAIPADLKEAARSYRIAGWQRFKALYFPAVFPFLITGWVTATGGAWNASIVAEFIEETKQTANGPEKTIRAAKGLGAVIMKAAAGATDEAAPRVEGTEKTGEEDTAEKPKATPDYPLLAAAVLLMSAIVVLFNRIVWHWCYRLAERKFSVQR
jgi:NitT/TauT family transport system permease protein